MNRCCLSFRGTTLCLTILWTSTITVWSREGVPVTNLELAESDSTLSGRWLAFTVYERHQGEDLNGDGDREDRVLHVHDFEKAGTTNLGLDAGIGGISDKWLVFGVSERGQGEDLNQDGDAFDILLHVRDLEAGETTNHGLALSSGFGFLGVHLSGKWLAFLVYEPRQGEDLNGDGDREDGVVHVADLEAGEMRNLELAGIDLSGCDSGLSGKWLLFDVPEADQGEDLNDDGDLEDKIVHVADLEAFRALSFGFAGYGTSGCEAALSDEWLAFEVSESLQGEDLNGDGDLEDSVLHVRDLEGDETANLGLAASTSALSGRWLAFSVYEQSQGADLNGDGDREDNVLHVRDLEAGETANLGLAASAGALSGKWLAFSVYEQGQGADLNGDGDASDSVLHVRDLEAAETTNLELALASSRPVCDLAYLSGTWLAVGVSEEAQGEDLNQDGDTDDEVLYVRDLEARETTSLGLALQDKFRIGVSGKWLGLSVSEQGQGEDLNHDGDTNDAVLYVHDLEAGETTSLGFALSNKVPIAVSDDWLAFGVSEDAQGEDLNGDGDTDDPVLHVADLSRLPMPRFLRGDCNADGDTRGVTDALFLLNFNFGGGREPPCLAACDANGDGDTGGMTDAVYLLSFKFLGTPPPPEPFLRCGTGARGSDFELGCEAAHGCTSKEESP